MSLTAMHSHDQHTHRLLTEIETGTNMSQRSLARRLGIALGLTNLLLRRVIRKGWVRMIQIKPNRVSYLLTPTGITEKAKMSRDSLQYSLRFYSEARQRVSARFAELSMTWPVNGGEKRIVFFGTGEIAEIGFVCLQETDLRLVAVVDDSRNTRFFGMPISSPERLSRTAVDGKTYDRLVVMCFDATDAVKATLLAHDVPSERVFWL